MYAIINDRRIPDDTLNLVLLSLGGGVEITGEAVTEQQRIQSDAVLNSIHENDTVAFNIEDYQFHKFHGAGTIKKLDREEQPIGTLMRLKYHISIQYVH